MIRSGIVKAVLIFYFVLPESDILDKFDHIYYNNIMELYSSGVSGVSCGINIMFRHIQQANFSVFKLNAEYGGGFTADCAAVI